tara:strand:+ start:1082 stop:1270 length:189 start_codon:yes stop_codon:yes gene_type:complete
MTHSRETFGDDMTQEEIEIMIRAMEEHLEMAETAKSPDLMQAIEDALAALEEMAASASPDDY